MTQAKELLFNTTLDYGKGYYDFTEKIKIENKKENEKKKKENEEKKKEKKNEKEEEKEKEEKKKKEEEEEGQFSQICDPFEKIGKGMLDYHISQIMYLTNKEKRNIQYMSITYKNINTNKEEVLFDTGNFNPADNENVTKVKFEDKEQIEDVVFYLSKEGFLKGFRIMTDLNPSGQIIGFEDLDYQFKDPKLSGKKNIVISFGGNVSKKHGLSSLFCIYISKYNFDSIKYIGLFELRAKLMKDAQFKNDIKNMELNEDMKFICDICGLSEILYDEVYLCLSHMNE